MSTMKVICGRAEEYAGPRPDLVFTNPYGPLPPACIGVPSIFDLYLPPNQEEHRKRNCVRWAKIESVFTVGYWSDNKNNGIYTANLPERTIDLTDLYCDQVYPGGGCFPEELCRRLFVLYADCIPKGGLVWDGFMGRGTVGKVAWELGYSYVGMDRDPARVKIAVDYLPGLWDRPHGRAR